MSFFSFRLKSSSRSLYSLTFSTSIGSFYFFALFRSKDLLRLRSFVYLRPPLTSKRLLIYMATDLFLLTMLILFFANWIASLPLWILLSLLPTILRNVLLLLHVLINLFFPFLLRLGYSRIPKTALNFKLTSKILQFFLDANSLQFSLFRYRQEPFDLQPFSHQSTYTQFSNHSYARILFW